MSDTGFFATSEEFEIKPDGTHVDYPAEYAGLAQSTGAGNTTAAPSGSGVPSSSGVAQSSGAVQSSGGPQSSGGLAQSSGPALSSPFTSLPGAYTPSPTAKPSAAAERAVVGVPLAAVILVAVVSVL